MLSNLLKFTPQVIIDKAKRLLDEEISAIQETKEYINNDFCTAIELLVNCKGKVVISGIGKSGHVSRKMAATMVSLGISAVYMNPAEAIHGDLGLVQSNDVVISISKSGESQEILTILPAIKQFGAKVIAITSNPASNMAQLADVILQLGVDREAGHLNLAPTSSVIASLAIGDAMATVAAELKGFKEEHFAVYHPGGTLGRNLTLNVENLLSENSVSFVHIEDSFHDVLIELTTKRIGATVVLRDDEVVGIITDGDLKRVLERFQKDCFDLRAEDIMVPYPIVIRKGIKVSKALEIMEQGERSISVVPVLDHREKYLGTLRIHDIVRGI